jgi:hypothetical protein
LYEFDHFFKSSGLLAGLCFTSPPQLDGNRLLDLQIAIGKVEEGR